MDCPNCNTIIDEKYCSQCGRPAELPRIDGQYIRKEIGSVLSFDKGILLTIRELVLRPGQNIREFLFNDRNRLVKPIIFIIICSLSYTLSQRLLNFEDGYFNFSSETEDSAILTIFSWVQKNYGYANIIIAFFIAFWTQLLFRKSGYNFFEILVLIFFIIGVGMLIFSVFGIIDALTPIRILNIGGITGMLYAAWAIGQFFDKKKMLNYLKAALSYVLGIVSFSLLAILLGTIVDAIKNS